MKDSFLLLIINTYHLQDYMDPYIVFLIYIATLHLYSKRIPHMSLGTYWTSMVWNITVTYSLLNWIAAMIYIVFHRS